MNAEKEKFLRSLRSFAAEKFRVFPAFVRLRHGRGVVLGCGKVPGNCGFAKHSYKFNFRRSEILSVEEMASGGSPNAAGGTPALPFFAPLH